ncbi:MAG: CHAT domain-containing protein [Myxococcales bacterium]|nr:CHAT domain-containing protein [Myxococcales bacterium]
MADPVTILFLGANPDGSARLRLDREVREIRRALEQTALRERFRLETLWASSFEDLLDGLLRHAPAVVHFSGHGRPDALLFEGADGKASAVSVEALARLFGALTGQVRLVVFNACDSLRAAAAVAPFVECAVGTTEPVGDRGAAAFAAAFYRGIGYGRTVAEAAELGRSAILAAGLAGADDLVLTPRTGVDPGRLVLVASDRGRPIDPKVLDATPIELTVHLTRELDRVRVRYVHDGRPLPGHEPGGGGLLTAAPPPAPGSAVSGNTMFSLLFPDALARVELMRALTGAATQPSPDRYRWRIRIRTDDPAFLRWPWARTAWEGQPLAAGARPWTFEVSAEDAPRLVASLPAGGRVVAYAPIERADEVARLQAALAAGAGAYARDGFQVVRTVDELRDAWRGRPAAVLVLGADPGVGPMAAVFCPTLLYLAGFDGADLAIRAPLAVVDARPEPGAWVAAAVSFWQQVVLAGGDPVATANTAGGGALQVHTRFSRWQASEGRDMPGWPHPRRRLDREVQRARAYEQVQKLVENRARRTVAVVATGEPGHEVLALSELLEDHFKRRGRGQFRIQRLRVAFPADREHLGDGLVLLLHDALRHDPAGRLGDSLDAAGPRRLGDTARVLWLDWGAFGGSPGLEPPLRLQDLRAWLALCEEVIAEQCPPGLSVYCTLAAETGRHDLVEQTVADHGQEFRERFAAYVLPPLTHVTLAELQDYFSDPDNTGIDRGLAGRAASVLYRVTTGDYATLLRDIERGERLGWKPLLDDLDRGTRPPAAGDDELL